MRDHKKKSCRKEEGIKRGKETLLESKRAFVWKSDNFIRWYNIYLFIFEEEISFNYMLSVYYDDCDD